MCFTTDIMTIKLLRKYISINEPSGIHHVVYNQAVETAYTNM